MKLLEVAKVHRSAGRLGDAALALHEAVRAEPMNPEIWFQGATLAIDLREFELARSLFEMCRRVVPNDAMAVYNAGYCAFRLGDPEAARTAYRDAIAIDPRFLRAHIALGQVSYILGAPEEGQRAFDAALALPRPKGSGDLELRALIRVVRGEFADGWAEFDDAWAQSRTERIGRHRLWDGMAAPDATICLTVDGGFGDTILFARFAHAVRARVGRLLVLVEPAIAPLIATIDAIDEVLTDAQHVPSHALLSGFWTLPRKLHTTPETIPATTPYLRPADHGPTLPAAPPFRAGIVWYGGRNCAHDFDRSAPSIAPMRPLFEVPGVSWVNLQPSTSSDAAARRDDLDEASRLGIAEMPAVSNFAETAFLLRQLDLVITVDTAIGNLSAALGVPTWIMIPTLPEFRWPIDAKVSPWYPQARLFRRRHTRDWAQVADDVATALRERLAEGSDRLVPAYRRLNVG